MSQRASIQAGLVEKRVQGQRIAQREPFGSCLHSNRGDLSDGTAGVGERAKATANSDVGAGMTVNIRTGRTRNLPAGGDLPVLPESVVTFDGTAVNLMSGAAKPANAQSRQV